MIYKSTDNKKIFQEVDTIVTQYEDTPIDIMDKLQFTQYKIIRMCEFYSNSRFIDGQLDEIGREKPFYNIVNFRVTLAKVATALDVKDIQIESDEPSDWVRSMFLNHEAYEWMKEINFANFLKDFTQKRAKYGGVLAKKSMQKGVLHIDTCDWRNMVTDQVDMLGGVIIENHYMTPVELSKKESSWDNVEEAIKLATQKKLTRKRGYNQEQYTTTRVTVREVHGEFPVAFLKDAKGEDYDDNDLYKYSLQRYFLSTIGTQKFIFSADEVSELPYDYIPWEEMPGRALGRGVIEDSEEAQIWTNDSVINEKHAMDLAGKVVVKTTSKKLGNNILTVDNGKIFELENGATLDALELSPAALGEFENQIERWQKQADYSTSSFDANTGANPPADTPYSQTALLNQVAGKPFDYRREEAGQFIQRLFTNWITPYLIKKLYKGHILRSEFSDEELAVIDASFAIDKTNKTVLKKMLGVNFQDLLKGQKLTPTPDEYAGSIQQNKSMLRGKDRYIKFPTNYFDDTETKVTVQTTNEMRNKQAIMQSLSTILQTVSQSFNPQTGEFMILKDPVLSRIFGKIVEIAGADISPTTLGISANPQPTSTPTPSTPAPAPTTPIPAPKSPVSPVQPTATPVQ